MRDPQLALQKAIYSRLKANVALTDRLEETGGGLYDNVPDETVYPRVVIGDDTLVDWDTDTSFGAEMTLTIHVWTGSPKGAEQVIAAGRREVKELMALVYQALHEVDLAVESFDTVFIRREFSTSMVEGDGATRHGVMRFRAIVTEIEED